MISKSDSNLNSLNLSKATLYAFNKKGIKIKRNKFFCEFQFFMKIVNKKSLNLEIASKKFINRKNRQSSYFCFFI